MSGQRLAVAAVVVVGGGLGVLIAGVPNVSPEMTVSIDASESASASTTTSTREVAAPPAAPAPPASEQASPRHEPSEVTVIVLNGAGVDGAAGATSSTLDDLGYETLPPSNTDQQDQTIVYFADGYDGDALAVVALVDPAGSVAPLPDPVPFSDAEGAHLVVVLGQTFEGSGGESDSETPPSDAAANEPEPEQPDEPPGEEPAPAAGAEDG